MVWFSCDEFGVDLWRFGPKRDRVPFLADLVVDGEGEEDGVVFGFAAFGAGGDDEGDAGAGDDAAGAGVA